MFPQEFKKAVQDKDIIAIRAIIKNHLVSDQRRADSLAQAELKYAQDNGLEVYVEDDGESVFDDDRHQWTAEFFVKLFIELHDNFSKQKIDNLFTVMSYLRETGHPKFQVRATSTSEGSNDADKGRGASSNLWRIAGGVAVLACAFIAYKALVE